MITALSILLYIAAILFAAALGHIVAELNHDPASTTRTELIGALCLVAFFFVAAVIAQVWS